MTMTMTMTMTSIEHAFNKIKSSSLWTSHLNTRGFQPPYKFVFILDAPTLAHRSAADVNDVPLTRTRTQALPDALPEHFPAPDLVKVMTELTIGRKFPYSRQTGKLPLLLK